MSYYFEYPVQKSVARFWVVGGVKVFLRTTCCCQKSKKILQSNINGRLVYDIGRKFDIVILGESTLQ
jgi:hypothetical protein